MGEVTPHATCQLSLTKWKNKCKVCKEYRQHFFTCKFKGCKQRRVVAHRCRCVRNGG